MKYTEEIFNILSRGGFISANSVSSTVKRYYDALEEDFTEYYDYYKVLIYISTLENHRKAGVGKSPNQSFLFI